MTDRDVIRATAGQIEMAKVHVKASRILGEEPDPFTLRIASATPAPSATKDSRHGRDTNDASTSGDCEIGCVTRGQIEMAKVHIKASRLLGEEPDPLTVRIANAARPGPRAESSART